MPFRLYVVLWILISVFMTFEYVAINYYTDISMLVYLQSQLGMLPQTKLITNPGKTISYFLGWLGFSLVLITNLYIFRKRWSVLSKLGRLPGWLNFHIFCGLLGPTCILFHTDFKIGGLVAISFWSMMIVAGSGVVGRYFYVQVIKGEKKMIKEREHWDTILGKMQRKSSVPIKDDVIDRLKQKALRFVGAPVGNGQSSLISSVGIFFMSIIGDLRLMFSSPATVKGLHRQSSEVLANYALAQRKISYVRPFQQLLGYWHSFHIPFAIAMYVTAIIHITVALLFQV